MRNTAATNTLLQMVHGFLSRKNPVKYNTRNMAWLYTRAGLNGFGISRTGINHWRQYMMNEI